MKRRNFLIGVGGTAIGGSALLGTGAFSRVESQRSVTIEVAEDPSAYLGLKPLDTPNSNNYVDLDDHGHLRINVNEHDDFQDDPDGASPGEGVNSDSFTYFDGMFELCNQGKAEADISYVLPRETSGDITSPGEYPTNRTYGNVSDDDSWEAPSPDYDEQVLTFYYISEGGDDPGDDGDRIMVQEGQTVPLALGECREIGLRTVTKGVDATLPDPLVDGEVVITAVSEDAGESPP